MKSTVSPAKTDEPMPRRRFALRSGADGRRMMLARGAFRPGDVILRFRGTLVQARPEEPALGLGEDAWLLLDTEAAAVRHACHPNAVLVDEASGPLLRALRAIRYGEVIAYDHATWIAPGDRDSRGACLCGAADCRRVVGAVTMLPRTQWAQFLELGAIPGRLRDTLP